MTNYYSQEIPKILNKSDRVRIGGQIAAVLRQHFGDFRKAKCLDIGCSSGIITNMLSDLFDEVVGIDVDKIALDSAKANFKKKNLRFLEMDASKLLFRNNKFDVVIANQIYEFVKDDDRVFKEVYRVLKKGGICFFGARNKYAVVEAQYGIPFLSWFPKRISDFIVRVSGKGSEFVGKYRSYWELTKLVRKFKVHDYTLKIIRQPELYGFRHLEKYSFLARILPMEFFHPLIPNYIWILKK